MDDFSNQNFSEQEWNALNYIMSTIMNIDNFKNLLKEKHPIINKYIQHIRTPWIRKWVIELAESTKILSEKTKNGIKLIDKLKTNFNEAIILLYVSLCFFKSNCNIEFIIENNKDRLVNLKVNKDNKNEIFVECTEINYSDQEKRIHQTWKNLTDILFTTKPLYHRGKLLKEFVSNKELIKLQIN